MFEDIIRTTTLQSFLSNYPQDNWKQCLEATLLYGIQILSKKYPFGPTLNQLFSLSSISPALPTFKVTIKRQKSPTNTEQHNKKFPNYLKHVKSKIHENVKKDIESYKTKNGTKKNTRPLHLKIPSNIEEPNTCTIGQAQSYIQVLPTRSSSSRTHDKRRMLKLADEFLSNPFTSYVLNNEKYSVQSPSCVDLLSPQSKLFSSIEMFSEVNR